MMGACPVCVTVDVLFVCLVAGVSVKVKDAPRLSLKRQHHGLLYTDNSTWRTATHWAVQSVLCDVPNWIEENYKVCGDGYCRCRDQVADCSKHFGNLTYIPRLPPGISQVVYTTNELVTISEEDFFANITHVADLDLSGNKMVFISPGVFRSFTNLTALRLTNNKLTYGSLSPVLSITSLTILDLSANPLGSPPDGIFDKYPMQKLQALCLNINQMTSLNMKVLSPLGSLIYLEVALNTLSTLHPNYLPSLQFLFLAWNALSDVFETCRNNSSLFPNLAVLDISSNPLNHFPPSSVCLPNLHHLALLSTGLYVISKESFSHHLFPSLQYVNLQKSVYIERIEKGAFRNPTLKSLTLNGSGIDFGSDAIDPDMFAGCPQLRALELSDNHFGAVSDGKFKRLLGHLTSLEGLGLSSVDIDQVPVSALANLTKLYVLSLANNKVTDIPDGAFDALPLKRLGLGYNRISVVRETTFSLATRQRLTLLVLTDNPFLCSCDLRWFRDWLISQPALFYAPDYYKCHNLINTAVQSFYVADQACLWSSAVSKFIIAGVGFLLVPLMLGTLIYRYRWHIRLAMYEAYRGRNMDKRRRRLQEQHFEYDVFVCYNNEDLNWVQQQLMPELEGRLRLRLCVHQRDFLLGAPIVENIETSVKTSKKVMMIFSRSFAQSHWCQFELQLCLTHMLENDDELLVVLLHEIPPRDLTPAMMAVMKTTTYIEWKDEADAKASFWGRIQLALNEILPAPPQEE